MLCYTLKDTLYIIQILICVFHSKKLTLFTKNITMISYEELI